jgi:predicted RNase H-like nuclease (RuvC/YqgF family)
MTRAGRLERKLKRLRSIEASYRREIKAAERDYEDGRISREKLERIRRRCNRKIEKLLSRIRELSRRSS